MKRTLVSMMAIGALAVAGHAQTASSQLTREMGIDQKLGATVPVTIPFKDEEGKVVTLSAYLGKRPVVLVPIFYKCETGCALITNGLLQTLLKASHPTGLMGMMAKSAPSHPLELGKDLEVVMLGIDPRETPDLAANKKNLIMSALGDPKGDANWHLLTGSYTNIRAVTDAIGFHYYFNPKNGVIRHPTCSVILSPSGKISSYTIGNEFPTRLLEDSLTVASHNEVGQRADQSFMFGCLMLDPETKKIRVVVEGLVRVGAVITLLVLGFSIFRMIQTERRQARLVGGTPSGI